MQISKYLKANCRNIVDFGRVRFFVFRKHTKFIHHLNNRPAYDFTKFFSEIKGIRIIGIADKRYGPIGVQQQLITGLKLYGSLAIFSFSKYSEDGVRILFGYPIR